MTRWTCGAAVVLLAVPTAGAQFAPAPPGPPLVPLGFPQPVVPQPPGRPRPPAPATGKDAAPPKFDRHGDALPAGAVARYGTVRLRHGSEPIALAFTPDGKTLGSLANTPDGVRLWDPVTGKETARLTAPVQYAALARDGSVVFVDEGRCKHWVPLTNAVRDLPEKTLPDNVTCLAVNPNVRSFAVAAPQKVTLVDLPTGKRTHELRYPADQPLHQLVYSSDGRWLAGAGQNTGLFLWDLRTFKRVRTYRVENVPDFAFSTDGTRLVVAGGGDRVRVYPTDSEELLDGFKPPEGEYTCPRFSPDGKWVYAVTHSSDFVRINAETGEADEPVGAPGSGVRPPVAVAPDGTMIAAVDASGGIRIWNPKTGKGPEAERLPVLVRPGFSADGKTVRALATEGVLHAFDAATGKPHKEVNLPLAEDGAANWDPVTRRATAVVSGDDLVLQVIDADTLKTVGKLTVPVGAGFPQPAFCPTDRNRVALFLQGSVQVFNVATGKMLQAIHLGKPEESPPSHGALSPDGRLVAVTSAGTLTVWEVATGKKRFDLGTLQSAAAGAAFSPDGRKLVAWDPVGTVVVFDLRFGTVARRITTEAQGENMAVVFSPDGKRIATGGQDGCVCVWDAATGDRVAVFDRHDGAVLGLAWSPDGTRVASSSADSTVLVWAVPERAAAAPPEAVVAGFDEAFKLLGSPDAAAAQRGMELLYRNPVEAAKQCRDRIPVPAAVDPGRVTKLIAALDDEEFQTRSAAVKDLEAIGGEAVSELKKVVASSTSAEVRKLAGEVVTRIEVGASRPDDVRAMRAIEVLEGIGTAETKAVLAAWAAGPPGHRLTTEAAAALARLKVSEK